MQPLQSSSLILKNAIILENYRELSETNKQPKLGVYRKNQLIIVSQKAVRWHEFVVEFFKKCLCFVCEKLGLISYNKASIQKIQQSIDDFYIKQQINLNKSQSLAKDSKNQIQKLDALRLEIKELVQRKWDIKDEITSLEDHKQTEDLNHRVLLLEIEHKSKELAKLTTELKSLEEKTAELNKVKAEISKLQPILQENAKKVKQLEDYEKTIINLARKISQLQSGLAALENKIGLAKASEAAFEDGRQAERTMAARRANAEFPERNNYYCSNCVASAVIEVQRKRGILLSAGPRITSIAAVCQGSGHMGERNIFVGHRLFKL